MAKRGGRLHKPTAAELEAKKRREEEARKRRNTRTKATGGCADNCRGGWVLLGKGRRRRCPSCNPLKTQGTPTGKPKNKSARVGINHPGW